jgi:hypothetical protein
VANELITCLQKLTGDHHPSIWQSIGSALRTQWDRNKIEDLAKRLQSFREQIALRIMVLLNAKSDFQALRQAETLDVLQRSNKDIIEIISINSNTLQSVLKDHVRKTGQLHRDNTIAAQLRHEETIAAILTLRDGHTEGISRLFNKNAESTASQSTGRCQSSLTFKEGTDHLQFEQEPESQDRIVKDFVQGSRSLNLDTVRPKFVEKPLPPRVMIDDFDLVLRKVLDCLYFRQITDRADEIAQAHQKTFEWIFLDPVVEQKPWDNFAEWLEYGKGCYWICGKAGSGKSTLMKFVQGHPVTQRALTAWAGQGNLVTASFYFWNLGSVLQNSHSGLIRSLLFDILDQRRSLIPVVFPGMCRSALRDKETLLSEPSFTELKRAFLSLLQLKSTDLRICLFIDGVDEYDGDHTQIVELLTVIASSQCVKAVLSSRPVPVCVDAFSQYETLHLQDLTYDDIQLYVEDSLGKHPNMMRMKAREQIAATDLVTEICSKASGVFLWVMLVVRSLLHGLRNHDRISDLRRRLEELPGDLEMLYQHMLQTMSPLYRRQASELFQIVLTSAKVQPEQPLSLLQLSFAEEEDIACSIDAEIRPLPAAIELARCEATEGRLRSRCCGLLEVHEKRFHTGENPSASARCSSPRRLYITAVEFKEKRVRKREESSDSTSRFSVGFLHKTVVEFLRIDGNWDKIMAETAGTDFDPHVALLSSCLYEAKVVPFERNSLLETSHHLWILCRRFFLYCMLAEGTTQVAQTAFVNEFRKSIGLTLQSFMHKFQKSLEDTSGDWVAYMGFDKSFANLAVRSGLCLFIEEWPITEESELTPLLQEALEQFIYACGNGKDHFELQGYRSFDYVIPEKLFSKLVLTLLWKGGNPNNPGTPLTTGLSKSDDFELPSAWELVLDHALFLRGGRELFLRDFREDSPNLRFSGILRELVVAGADPNAVRTHGIYQKSALNIIEELLTPSGGLVKDAAEHITTLLVERGAVGRQWRNGNLILGPPLESPLKSSSASSPVPTTITTAAGKKRANRIRQIWTKLKGINENVEIDKLKHYHS